MTATATKRRGGFRSGRAYAAFLGGAFLILGVMIALGWGPTLRQGGPEAVSAMLAGCSISLLGAIAGSLPIRLSEGKPIPERMPAVYASIGLRLGVILVLALAVALTGVFAAKPLLLWVAISHAGLLLADSAYAVINLRAPLAARVVEEL